MGRKLKINKMIVPNMTEDSRKRYLAGELGFGAKADFVCHKCGRVKRATIQGYRPDSLCRSCASKRRMAELSIKDYLFREDVHPADRETAMGGRYETVRVWCKHCNRFVARTQADLTCPRCGK